MTELVGVEVSGLSRRLDELNERLALIHAAIVSLIDVVSELVEPPS